MSRRTGRWVGGSGAFPDSGAAAGRWLVATQVISELGPVLVAAAGVRAGDRVLDVAAGSGNATIPAALTGADVVACDLTPELLAAWREIAAAQGAQLTWDEADAEALPYPDGSFDSMLSCVGAMFTQHHQRTADELLRVTRPGGTIGLISWTTAGFVGEMFRTMRPYAPPPAGARCPRPCGARRTMPANCSAVEFAMLLRADRRSLSTASPNPQKWLDFFKATYGPTSAIYRHIGDDPGRAAALDHELLALAERYDRGTTTTVMDWEYLRVTARTRG